jgi:hypothetical protein
MIGLGKHDANFTVYIGNTPPLLRYRQLSTIEAMQAGEIAHIANETGNHWRKVFNVYAKLFFCWCDEGHNSWQQFRDNELLQAHSGQRLIFGQQLEQPQGIDIIAGKQHALNLVEPGKLDWLGNDFAIHRDRALIVCPYFDYRQLSNHKIDQLCQLIAQLATHSDPEINQST